MLRQLLLPVRSPLAAVTLAILAAVILAATPKAVPLEANIDFDPKIASRFSGWLFLCLNLSDIGTEMHILERDGFCGGIGPFDGLVQACAQSGNA